MPDLVIKPTATSGNKLILKAQDGTTILTTSDSGATITGELVPSTAYSHRNMIINGEMQVWQRSTDITASDGSNEGYNSIDRWYFNFNSSCPGTLDIDKSTDTPSGFGSSMKLKCNATGTPAGSSTDYVIAHTTLEAQDLQRLCYGTADAKVTTLSWYMKSVNFTTPIGIYLETFDGTKEYYHVNATPTTSWARYSVTIPKSTSATITNDNGAGLLIGFVLSGSDGSVAEANDSSAWSTTQKVYRSNQTNFFASTSNELYITGLQFELGENATPYEHRSYGEELRRCERYYEKIYDGSECSSGVEMRIGSGFFWKQDQLQVIAPFRTRKRAVPTFEEVEGTNYYKADRFSAEKLSGNIGSDASGNTPDRFHVWLTSFDTGNDTEGNAWEMRTNNALAKGAFTAEL